MDSSEAVKNFIGASEQGMERRRRRRRRVKGGYKEGGERALRERPGRLLSDEE